MDYTWLIGDLLLPLFEIIFKGKYKKTVFFSFFYYYYFPTGIGFINERKSISWASTEILLCVKKIHHQSVIALSIWQSKTHTEKRPPCDFWMQRNRIGKPPPSPFAWTDQSRNRWTHIQRTMYKKSILHMTAERPSALQKWEKTRPPFKPSKKQQQRNEM
jgi:hypothetical protein